MAYRGWDNYMGFIDKLRMNSLFPIQPLPSQPTYGGSADPLDTLMGMYHSARLYGPDSDNGPSGRTAGLEKIARQASAPQAGQSTKPMNVVMGHDPYNDMTAFQKASLNQRDKESKIRDENTDLNRDISGQRVGIADWKAKHPNNKFVQDEDGNVIMVNPITGEQIDTGISQLSPREKLDLQNENRNKIIDKQFGNTKELTDIKNKNTSALQEDRQIFETELEGKRQEGRIALKGTATPLKDMLPTQRAKEIDNRIQQAKSEHPEWAMHINADGTIAPVGNGYGANDLTEAKRSEIYNAIYGDSARTPKYNNNNNNTTLPKTTNQLPVPEQREIGKTYTMGNGQPGIWTGKGFKPATGSQ